MTRPDLLHEFFDRHWRTSPDHVAVDVPPGRERPARRTITYGELGRRSHAIAAALRPLVTGESIVALFVARTSPDAYAAQLAVMRAGAAYTAFDSAAPDARLRDILADTAAVAVLCDDASADRVARLGLDPRTIINLDRLTTTPDAGTDAPAAVAPPAWLTPSTLAYLIYTSGTTGRPKGVMIEHRSIANLVASDVDEFRLTSADRVGQNSSHAYDSSIEEIWLAFGAGATLVVMDDDIVRAGPDLPAWLERERLTVFCPPPTLLRATGCRDAARRLPALLVVYVGGEALPRDVAETWSIGRRLVNGYGPTESTVTAIRCDVTTPDSVPVGRPVSGLHAWILDESLTEVPDGDRGELCLGGAGLARGYWQAPDLTSARFPVHPRLGRLYRTGDIAHRGPDGLIYCHGRVDSQVKLRGYRIELEDVEAHLARCPGVRAAACTIAQSGAAARLVAFVVPDPSAPPAPDAMRAFMAQAVPSYMVPARFEYLAVLPTSLSGKLNRAALPAIDDRADGAITAETSPDADPLDAIGALIRDAARRVFATDAIGSTDDFFEALGADSLRAAELITALRDHELTRHLTVRDVYESPSVRALAARARAAHTSAGPSAAHTPASTPRTFWFTAVQTTALVIWVSIAATLSYVAAVVALPRLLLAVGLERFVLLLPIVVGAALTLYAAFAIAAAVVLKRFVIGRYTAMRAPLWGSFHLRHWIVEHAVRRIPWRLLEGGELQAVVLRLLGARIGQRVHIHRGVDLRHGGWDLLTIGDDASLGRDVSLDVVDFSEGAIVAGPIVIGRDATIETGAGLSADTVVGAGASLSALSSLPAGSRVPDGERWSGVPAERVGVTGPAPAMTDAGRLGPFAFTAVTALIRGAAGAITLGPTAATLIAIVMTGGWTGADLLQWLAAPAVTWRSTAIFFAAVLIPVPITMVMRAVAARALGTLSTGVVDRWSVAYIRAAVKIDLLESAGIWLAGSLLWPSWLRLAGMRVGRACEISTILDVIPEHVAIGHGSFLTDGIYLAGPLVTRGTVTLAATDLGRNTFIGNRAVIPAGQHLPADVLIGVSTVADDSRMHEGTSWFGHPPFDLHRRPAVDHEKPTRPAYVMRVFWELLRFSLPLPLAAVNIAWFSALSGRTNDSLLAVSGAAIGITLAAGGTLAGLVLALKWLLLGRVSPGQHRFWSCWCGRWDFHYVAWDCLARPMLQGLEGTLLLAWYLRAMGCRIGRRVLLGAGFAQVVDPDMLVVGDDAVLLGMLQAHTFEDRLLKIDRIHIGHRATIANHALLFYGSHVGDDAYVAPHSVVMKHEGLLPGQAYEGCPTKPVARDAVGGGGGSSRSARRAVAVVGLAFVVLSITLSAAPRQNRSGPVLASVANNRLTLGNGRVSAEWSVAGGKLTFTSTRTPGATTDLITFDVVFALTTRAGVEIPASAMTMTGAPSVGQIVADSKAVSAAERLPGKLIAVRLRAAGIDAPILWQALLREGADYWQQTITIGPLPTDLDLARVTMLHGQAPGARVAGTVAGSPVVAGRAFAGVEHPMATCAVTSDLLTCGLARTLPLPRGQTLTISAVVGAAPDPSQLRRTFNAYVERERVQPYRPFLHYNSWYDLGYFTPYTEQDALAVIDTFGRELVEARHVVLSSFLFDDGWDSHTSLWSFNRGFPNGFAALTTAAAKFGAAPGVWLSPFGGYGAPRAERLTYGRQQGFETNERGFALSGPVYYARFRDVCLEMMSRFGINQFKFDGIGRATGVVPGSAFGSDFEAAIHLIRHDLRAKKPDVFVNLTTGTWPSPFWLQYADTIWRGGEDHDFAGVGSKRQQWITYRDAQTYKNIVQAGPLFPLSSLMLHGLIYARDAANLKTDPNGDFRDEVRSYFASGTELQEMYITPALLSATDWDAIAESAIWARANAATLVDTHWVGGDPARLEVYGHAAWSPTGDAILSLRNPSDAPATFDLDVTRAFELPASASGRAFTLRSPFASDRDRPAVTAAPGGHLTIVLKPFEVLTLQGRDR